MDWRPSLPFVDISRQPGELRSRFLEDRNVRVGVFPQLQEVGVGSLCARRVSGNDERTTQLKPYERADWIRHNDATVSENLLEFSGRVGALVRGQVGETAYVD